MRLRFFAFTSIAAATAILTIVACSSDPASGGNKLVVTDDDSGGGTVTKRDGSTPPPPPGPGPDGSAGPSKIYAHTDTTLYLFEDTTKGLTRIGTFDCIAPSDSVLDIAVDRTGAMFGTTYQAFISIDPVTAHCQIISDGSQNATSYPNSLSFVPAGTVDPTKEALVGYAYNNTNAYADQYSRIDTTTGDMTTIGDLNAGNSSAVKYRSSGDLISLILSNNKTYLTVKKINGDAGTDTTTDYLAEVNPTTGAIVKVLGPTGVPNLYGLGFWAGKAYGFSFDGKVISIDTTNGSSQLVTTLSADAGASWYGAGVTTMAPVAP